ncbi:GHMP kinase [Desulfurivibrio sp. D14AmB]|uniref:GHMP family kinase ATP-binding protein n=1 Tax=Desulfurivibrio sp. D14AmB TaxID=3374370 RepID=UPI00376F3FF3
MIISRTPLRMSFVGGGSDLPSFYREYGGAVVSTAIDKYIYVTVNRKFDNGIRVSYSVTEEVEQVADIRHELVRESLKFLELDGGIEITTIADIPSRGTGLGSSSSFTVGLLHVLNAFQHRYVSSAQLGEDSCRIEIDICGEPIGKQDQYAAAFGGFNLIEFKPDESVLVSPLICRPETIAAIEQGIMVFYTGITRSASKLLRRQSEDMAASVDKRTGMRRMVELAYLLGEELQRNNVSAFGEILHENWELKKSMTAGVSNPEIDQWYDAARSAGAQGGKLLGAGAGGFLMFYAPPYQHQAIREALPGLRQVPMGFEPLGSRIIFYH